MQRFSGILWSAPKRLLLSMHPPQLWMPCWPAAQQAAAVGRGPILSDGCAHNTISGTVCARASVCACVWPLDAPSFEQLAWHTTRTLAHLKPGICPASSNQNPGIWLTIWLMFVTYFFLIFFILIQSLLHLFHSSTAAAGRDVTLIQWSSENHPVHASHWPAPLYFIRCELPWSQNEVMAGLPVQVRVWFPLSSWKPSCAPFSDTCSSWIIDSKPISSSPPPISNCWLQIASVLIRDWWDAASCLVKKKKKKSSLGVCLPQRRGSARP